MCGCNKNKKKATVAQVKSDPTLDNHCGCDKSWVMLKNPNSQQVTSGVVIAYPNASVYGKSMRVRTSGRIRIIDSGSYNVDFSARAYLSPSPPGSNREITISLIANCVDGGDMREFYKQTMIIEDGGQYIRFSPIASMVRSNSDLYIQVTYDNQNVLGFRGATLNVMRV